jgi:hypothetical protein
MRLLLNYKLATHDSIVLVCRVLDRGSSGTLQQAYYPLTATN